MEKNVPPLTIVPKYLFHDVRARLAKLLFWNSFFVVHNFLTKIIFESSIREKIKIWPRKLCRYQMGTPSNTFVGMLQIKYNNIPKIVAKCYCLANDVFEWFWLE